MFQRASVLALVLLTGATAGLSSQSEERIFRRFGSRDMLRFERSARPLRFSADHSYRVRLNADRIRDVARARAFQSSRAAQRFQMSSRAAHRFQVSSRAAHRITLSSRAAQRRGDLIRLDSRLDRFRLERPRFLQRRHWRTI